MEKYYSVKEVAKILKFSEQTIRKLIRCQRIHAFQIGKGKQSPYRIYQSEIDRLMLIGYEQQMEAMKECIKEENNE